MRSYFSFSIRNLLLATAVVALMLAIGLCAHWRYFTPNGIYQSRREGSALLGILGEEIKNGDSRASVISRLGRGEIIDDADYLEAIRENIEQQPAAHVDGFQETDASFIYSAAEGFALHLQFRDDKLVNFDLPLSTRQAMRQHYKRYATAMD